MYKVKQTEMCPAWLMYRDAPTNYNLKDGDKVELNCVCKAEGSSGYYLLPKGTEGTVITARVPKVRKTKGSSAYFALVECVVDGASYLVRVPHRALLIINNN